MLNRKEQRTESGDGRRRSGGRKAVTRSSRNGSNEVRRKSVSGPRASQKRTSVSGLVRKTKSSQGRKRREVSLQSSANLKRFAGWISKRLRAYPIWFEAMRVTIVIAILFYLGNVGWKGWTEARGTQFYQELVEMSEASSMKMDRLKSASYQEKILAAVLVAEAANEGKGMVAVAEVIVRRMKERQQSPYEVITQRFQFSCLNRLAPHELLQKMVNHPEFPKALELAKVVYGSPEALPGIAMGANHYHATWMDKKPYWAVGRKPVVVIGNHAFYKL